MSSETSGFYISQMLCQRMLSVTHVAFAVLISLILLKSGFPLSAALFCLMGSLVPDIDSPFSSLGRNFRPFSWFFRHRGFFHTIFPGLVFSVLFLPFGVINAASFLAGFISHLLLDSLTRKGVRPFLFGKRFKGPLSSGGVVEMLLLIILLLLNLYFVILII